MGIVRMASQFTRNNPDKRAQMVKALAAGWLFPQEAMGPLMDCYELDELETLIAADPAEVNERVRQLLSETRVERLPVISFGPGPSEEDRVAWEAERWRIYQALLDSFGIAPPGSGLERRDA
jgi:hypothetical protein